MMTEQGRGGPGQAQDWGGGQCGSRRWGGRFTGARAGMDLIQKERGGLGDFILREGPRRMKGDLGEKRLGPETQCSLAKDLPATGADWHFHCNCWYHPEELRAMAHPLKVMQLISGNAKI